MDPDGEVFLSRMFDILPICKRIVDDSRRHLVVKLDFMEVPRLHFTRQQSQIFLGEDRALWFEGYDAEIARIQVEKKP